MPTNLTKRAVLDRIATIEENIAKAREYLESGAHAHWRGFRPFFKVKDGEVLPPHKDWVRNVFLPSCERALRKAEKLLDKLDSSKQKIREARTK